MRIALVFFHELAEEASIPVRTRVTALAHVVDPNFTLGLNIPYWGINEVKGITQFCEKLSDIERKAGRLPDGWEYAAPTEAQWEYACRAGSDSRYSFGDEVSRLGEYGNFADRTLEQFGALHHRHAKFSIAVALNHVPQDALDLAPHWGGIRQRDIHAAYTANFFSHLDTR